MKRRLAKLEFSLLDLNHELDAFDMGEILQELPDDAKIVSFGQELTRAVLSMVIECPTFKEIEDVSILPIIKWTLECDDGYYKLDLKDIEEPKPGSFFSVVDERYDIWKGHQYDAASGSLSLRTMQEFYNKVSQGTILYGTGFMSATTDSTNYVTFTNISYPEQFPKIESVTKEELAKQYPCIHEWKHYQGLMEEYDYCVKCDERKK